MWDGLLPIGSVVLLKGGEVPLMIIGLCQTRIEEADNPTKIFDYVGVGYPMGLTRPDEMYKFNREAIEKVYHIGYITDEMLEFLPTVEDLMQRLRDGSITAEDLRAVPENEAGQPEIP